MGDQPGRLDFQFRWAPELVRDFQRDKMDFRGRSSFVRCNFWSVTLALFFGFWLVMTVLAKAGVFPAEHLGLVLKATAASYVVALIPAIILSFRDPAAAFPADSDLQAAVSCDERGCRASLGRMTAFIPWGIVESVRQTRRGVILYAQGVGAAAIYDERLRDPSSRQHLLERIDAWRKAPA